MKIDPAALAFDGDDRIARSLLGSADSALIAKGLATFCRAALGRRPVECLFTHLSVGASFGVLLEDDSRVVIKAHGPRKSRDYLVAMRRVQHHLHASGFPAPRPRFGPAPFRLGFAVIDDYLEGGQLGDAKDPAIRTTMATTLARLVALASAVRGCEALAERRWPPSRAQLWPTPHNALFDFEATAPGAEWIDTLARQAQAVWSPPVGRIVVGHGDWSAQNLRMRDGNISAVFDWDSTLLDHETHIVGGAAAHFPYDDVRSDWIPSPDDARGFVRDYVSARDEPFSSEERAAVGASVLYGLAYTARCEHALDPTADLDGARAALATHELDYLRMSR